MELTKKDCFQTFTILNLAMCIYAGAQIPGALLYAAAGRWMMAQEAGVFRRLSGLFTSPWTNVLVQYVFVMGLANLLGWLTTRLVPAQKRNAKRMDGGEFLTLLVVSLGLAYVLNFIGNAVNLLFSVLNGKSFMDMNPVLDMMSELEPAMIIYACLLGPAMEEVMFRGILLRRARRFGDRTAVIFCAVLFGLMHGNLSQFLYATVIGIILGFVAVQTNSLRYNIWMHICLNSYSMVLVLGENTIMNLGVDVLLVPYTLAMLVSMALLVTGAVFFIVKNSKRWQWEFLSLSVFPASYRRLVYLNPGFILFALISIGEMLFYLL